MFEVHRFVFIVHYGRTCVRFVPIAALTKQLHGMIIHLSKHPTLKQLEHTATPLAISGQL